MRRHDHTGITVPDMNEALTFFVDVLDARRRCPLDRSPIRSRTAPS
jgi:catechol 2,3-dioxygenase-like lactoylglutathione lyase family enzyme